VEFPLDGLDIAPFMHPACPTPPLYDLQSVIYHHGSTFGA
jgi:hypothetical protein